jgi:hypothetical protein
VKEVVSYLSMHYLISIARNAIYGCVSFIVPLISHLGPVLGLVSLDQQGPCPCVYNFCLHLEVRVLLSLLLETN